MNAGDSVQKSMNAEETAVLQNIAALVQQALTMESAEENAPGQNGVEDAMNPAGVAKGAEQGRTPAEPQTVTDPKAPPKEKGMAPWDDNDEVKKAFATIAKSIQASDTDGVTANDSGEERTEEIPEIDEENVKEVAKALLAMAGKKKVAKSASAQPANVNAELLTVIKSLNAKVEAQGTVITEMLEGLGVAKAVESNPVASGVSTSVQKSGNRPYANLGDGNIVDVIAASVAKAMAATGSFQQSSGIPVAKGFGASYGHEDVRQFTEGFVGSAGDLWGSHELPNQ